MAYCTSANVISEFKGINIASSGTALSTTEVDRFIAEADAHIDSIISNRYEVPVTGATSLIILRQISIMLVCHRIKEILKVKSGNSDADQEGRGNSLRSQALKMLDDIVTKKMNLSDATLKDSSEGVSSYVSSNDVPFIFERGTEQW